MPWDRSRPNGGATAAKYRTPEHRAARAAMKAQIERDGHGYCAQPVCVKRSRLILPGSSWAAGHNDAGTAYIGPVHTACNGSDAGRRARARQNTSRLRW